MSDINTVAITGHLTKDAELRYTKNGAPVCNFSIAVNKDRYDKKNDAWSEETSFFDCTMYGKRAENAAENLCKGVFVTISGELQQQRWEKDGKRQSKVVIIVDGFKYVDRRDQNTQAEQQEGYYYSEDVPF